MSEEATETKTESKQSGISEQIWNKYFIGFILYFAFGSAFFKVIFIEHLLFPRATTQTLANLFLLLTSYPLFIRHIPNRWMKDKKPIKFSLWFLISVLISAIFYLPNKYLF